MNLEERARAWISGDPDPSTASALEGALVDRDMGELERAMGGTLEFGTAGIRGEVGPGSNRMNRAVVISTTKGLADYLIARNEGVPDRPVVVGFDARPSSRQFAIDTVGVLAACGFSVVAFDDVVPTPIVAFAAKTLDAEAAVVVTASHNPPADNGYKVYDSNAAQIIPPVDGDIAAMIAAVEAANKVELLPDPLSYESNLVRRPPDDLFELYKAEVNGYRSVIPKKSVPIMYTPLHGVGGRFIMEIFADSVHGEPGVVDAQFAPDGAFPTVEFPNPEEAGALDLAMESASSHNSELILANDPDADRLASALSIDNGWRLLTGNELGSIIGHHLLSNHAGDRRPITANSVVSSPMLSRIADSYGAEHLTTLTGFKWIENAALSVEESSDAEFLFGFEEALGYSVGRTVRDKDGISAALVLADIAGLQAEQGHTLLDYLADLWTRYGIWVSTQTSLVRPGPDGSEEIQAAVEELAASPPRAVAGHEVSGMVDYRFGAEERAPWLGAQSLIELKLGDSGRVLARPSGTEPKLKIYVDLTAATSEGHDIHAQRNALLAEAESAAAEVADRLG